MLKLVQTEYQKFVLFEFSVLFSCYFSLLCPLGFWNIYSHRFLVAHFSFNSSVVTCTLIFYSFISRICVSPLKVFAGFPLRAFEKQAVWILLTL